MTPRISRLLAMALVAGLSTAAAAVAEDPAAPAVSAGKKININQATSAQLAMLPRIGAKVADRIVEYRKAHGSFNQPEQLMEVKGIGEKLFLQLKPYLSLSGSTTLTAKISSKGTRGGSNARKSEPKPAAKPASNTVPVGKVR